MTDGMYTRINNTREIQNSHLHPNLKKAATGGKNTQRTLEQIS